MTTEIGGAAQVNMQNFGAATNESFSSISAWAIVKQPANATQQLWIENASNPTDQFAGPVISGHTGYFNASFSLSKYMNGSRNWTITDIDNLRLTIVHNMFGVGYTTQLGVYIRGNITSTTPHLDRYIYETGDTYSYHITVNETSTITVPTKPAWLSLVAHTTEAWLNGTADNTTWLPSVNISVVSTPGTLTTWQNYTIEVWGDVPEYNYWEASFTSAPTTNFNVGVLWLYEVTWNESVFDMNVAGNITDWVSWSGVSGNQSLWGTSNIVGWWNVNVTAWSTAGLLQSYQSFVVSYGALTWASNITSPLDTTWYTGVMFLWTITWDDPVTSLTVETTAGWLTWNPANNTLYGLTNATGSPFSVYINATSIAGTLDTNATYTFTVERPSATVRYFQWLADSGIMFVIGSIGFLGMIGIPLIALRYKTGDTRYRLVWAIGMWFMCFGLFWASLVVFG
jgi:hypothetical protein